MSGFRNKRYFATTLAFTALLAPLAADPMVDYSEALVPLDDFVRRAAAPEDSVLSQDLGAVVSLLSDKSAAERAALQQQFSDESGRPTFQLTGAQADRIQVYIYLHELNDEVLAALKAAGAEIELLSDSRPLVQAYVALDLLDAVARVPGVREVTRPSYGIPTAGQIDSQGFLLQNDALIHVNPRNPDARSTMIDGTGTMIGVISNGLFTSDASNCSGLYHFPDSSLPEGRQTDLPIGKVFANCGAVPPQGYFGDVQVYPAFLNQHLVTSGFPEGAAMMEVIHDVAPGAAMIYATARTSVELEDRRKFLMLGEYRNPNPANVNPRGLDAIADNLFFVGEGRYDGSSAVSRNAVTISRLHNIPYLVTAGGITPKARVGTTTTDRFPLQISGFFNGDPRETRAKIHSWSVGQATQRDEALNIRTDASNRLNITLVWDDLWDDTKPRATIDLDIFVVPRDSLSLSQAVAASTRLQNGNAHNPMERLSYFNASGANLALVMINKNNTQNAKPLFTLVIENGAVDESDYLTHGVALNNSDALKPIISIADYSLISSNPRDRLADSILPGKLPGNTFSRSFLRWYENQVFPVAVDYSAVNTRTTMSLNNVNGFTGPSAAVAHTAGLVGLLRHRFPEMTPTAMYDIFQDTSGRADDGTTIVPLASDVTPEQTLVYHRRPKYNRVNHFNLYNALNEGKINPFPPTGASTTPVLVAQANPIDSSGSAPSSDWTSQWKEEHNATEFAFDEADYRVSELGLELRPTSNFSYGSWASPLLTIQDSPDSAPRTELRTDRVYLIEARVGTTATNSLKVPDFRLRMTSALGDETAAVVIAGNTPGSESAPSNIGGNTYQVYYRPSNEAVAKQGVRFYFELLGFDPNDDLNASVILRDFNMREIPVPPVESQQ